MNKNIDAFLEIVRLGIGTSNYYSGSSNIKWEELDDLATLQGLSAILIDGIERLPDGVRLSQELLQQWIGESLHGYDYRYEMYQRAIAELAAFYNSHGYKMMVLNDYAFSIDWPKPAHRLCEKINIWLFGQQKEADIVLAREKCVIINKHHHNTIFRWDGFSVENQYGFINGNQHSSNDDLDFLFKELGADNSHYVEVHGEKVYMPSPNLHALFLSCHLLSYFASVGINLRQVLDWAFFLKKHSQEVDWAWLLPIADRYHMRDFFNCINAICVEDLGFEVSIFPSVQYLPELKDKVFNDIVNPKYRHEPTAQLFARLWFKYKRWKANEWKRKWRTLRIDS